MPKKNRSLPRIAESLISQCVSEGECWVRPSDKRRPYVYIDGKKTVAARILASVYLGLNINDPTVLVCHTCHNKRCLRIDHLYLGDRSTNATDKRFL